MPLDVDGTGLLQRDEELNQLDGALGRARQGSGIVAFIRGEAGIGKTTITRTFLQRQGDDAHILLGGCDDLLAPRPFQPFWDMANEEPGLENALRSGKPDLIYQQLAGLLSRSLRPSILVIEDAHWADQATLDMIKRLGRRIDRSHGLIILTYRDQETPVDHPLRSVIGDIPADSTIRLRLAPLNHESIAMMAGPEEADRLQRLTGGNPLLLTEILRSEDKVPSSVVDLVLGRLARLPEKSRRLVELASIFAGYCGENIAQAVIPFGRADLERCEQVGLVVSRPGRLVFRHELIRQAVERSLSQSTRIHLYRLVLEVYESLGMGEPSAWPADFNPALMVQLADELGDVNRLLRYAPAAASRAVASGSRREGVTLFELIGPHVDGLEPMERARLLEAWSDAISDLGDVIRSRQLRMQAAHLYREIGEDLELARCLVPMSALHWRSKQMEKAVENAALAVEALRSEIAPAELISEALSAQAMIHYIGDNLHEGNETINRAIAIAPPVSHQLAIAKAAAVWGTETWKEAQRLGQEALELADRVGSWHAVELAYRTLTQWDHELPPRDRTSVLDDALAFAEAHQLDDLRAFTLLGYAQQHIDAGRYIAAEDVAREAATIWPDSEQNLAAWPLATMASPQLRRGSPQARENFEKLSEFVPTGPPINDNLSAPMAEAHWLDSSLPFDRGMALVDHRFSVDHPGAWRIDDSSLIYWLWKLGIEVELPERVHSQYRHQIEGDWEAAAAEWSDWERPYEQALALSEGPPEAAISALAILDEIGAVPLATRIRRDLRERGVTGVPAGPRPSTRENVALLTARQMEVLRLMAEGGSNPEIADTLFISSRTAEHHVSAVLSKLNASTREEAVAMAADLGVLTAI